MQTVHQCLSQVMKETARTYISYANVCLYATGFSVIVCLQSTEYHYCSPIKPLESSCNCSQTSLTLHYTVDVTRQQGVMHDFTKSAGWCFDQVFHVCFKCPCACVIQHWSLVTEDASDLGDKLWTKSRWRLWASSPLKTLVKWPWSMHVLKFVKWGITLCLKKYASKWMFESGQPWLGLKGAQPTKSTLALLRDILQFYRKFSIYCWQIIK